jgi:hypothetical protein
MYVLMSEVIGRDCDVREEKQRGKTSYLYPKPPSGICKLMKGYMPSSCLCPEEVNVNNEDIT